MQTCKSSKSLITTQARLLIVKENITPFEERKNHVVLAFEEEKVLLPQENGVAFQWVLENLKRSRISCVKTLQLILLHADQGR